MASLIKPPPMPNNPFKNIAKERLKTPPAINLQLFSKKTTKAKTKKVSNTSTEKRNYRKESDDYYLIEDLYKYIDYTENEKSQGSSTSHINVDIKMVPKGTLLYTYIDYEDNGIPTDKLLMEYYLRTMFNITYDKKTNSWELCISPKDNSYKYYYASPLASHGVAGFGLDYNMCIPSITNRDLYFSYLKSSRHSSQDKNSLHRHPGRFKSHDKVGIKARESDYYETCDNDKSNSYSPQCGRKGKLYDICLSNKNRENRQIDGIISIANADSQVQINPSKNTNLLSMGYMFINLLDLLSIPDLYTEDQQKIIKDLILLTIPVVEADRRINTIITTFNKKKKISNTSVGLSEYTIPSFGWVASKLFKEIQNDDDDNDNINYNNSIFKDMNKKYNNNNKNNINYNNSIFKDMNNNKTVKNKLTDYITDRKYNVTDGTVIQYTLRIDDDDLETFIDKYLDKYISIKPIGLISKNFIYNFIKNKKILIDDIEYKHPDKNINSFAYKYHKIISLNINIKKYLDELDFSYNTNKQLYHLNDKKLASSYYKMIKCNFNLQPSQKLFSSLSLKNKNKNSTNSNGNKANNKNNNILLHKFIKNKLIELSNNDKDITLSSFSIKITKEDKNIENIIIQVILQEILTAYKFIKKKDDDGGLIKTKEKENTIYIFYDTENKNIITSSPFYQPFNNTTYNSDSSIIEYIEMLISILFNDTYNDKIPNIIRIKEYISNIIKNENKLILVGTIEKEKDTKLMETKLDINSNVVYTQFLNNYETDKDKRLSIKQLFAKSVDA
jgi:hypothetical protein